MPGFDGKGPQGLGPLTGGGRGYCVSRGDQGMLGTGRGLGRGLGRGRGRGCGWRRGTSLGNSMSENRPQNTNNKTT